MINILISLNNCVCGSTDDEDLGLPASLQNSPADTAVLDSLGGSRYWPALGRPGLHQCTAGTTAAAPTTVC